MIMQMPKFIAIPERAFWVAFSFNMVWINASEVFRYFIFIMPMMREAFPSITDIAPMNIPVFLIWGVWDTLLVFAVTGWCWVFMMHNGFTRYNAIVAGICVWLTIFVILWLGLFNMNLATPAILAVALPLSLLELVIAALITLWVHERYLSKSMHSS